MIRNPVPTSAALVALPLLVPLLAALPARADDYPQWMGPARDGVYRENGVAAQFPAGGPRLRWKTPVAGGYAGPAVFDGKVVVIDRVLRVGQEPPKNPFQRRTLPGTERVQCLSDKDGALLWKVEYDAPYGISYAAGPRCTPAVDPATRRVYTLGAEGHLYCIELDTGKVVWNLKLEGPTPIWGFAGHPLVDGDKVLVLSGGKEAVVTAFDKHTGKKIWGALTNKDPGYCPPMIHTVGGVRQVLMFHPEAVFSLDPETGKAYWTFKHGPLQNGVSIVPPLLVKGADLPAAGGDMLYATTANEGTLALRLNGTNPPEKVFHLPKKGRSFPSIHGLMNPLVLHDGHVFGVSHDGELRCMHPLTGATVWETTDPTTGDRGPTRWYTAFLTPYRPDGAGPARQFFIANEDGDLIIAQLSAKGYQEVSRAHLMDPTNTDARRPVLWSHPAYANRSVYWRNDKEVGCWSLGEQ